MDHPTAVECSACGERATGSARHRCDSGGATAGSLRLVHDIDCLRETFDPSGPVVDQWRYAQLLPVADSAAVSLGEGGTDLVDAPSLSERYGVDLSLKLDGANPTGSTKDRGSSVLVSHAVEVGAERVACASTGNAAASLAAYAARAGLDCRLFVPESVPDAKGVQPRMYGASVTAVDGGYDDAYERCRERTAGATWVDRSAGASPFTAAGARTLGYELAEQNDRVPDWVVVPMGNGGTLADAWRGFETFERVGGVEGTPRMLGVQSAAASPIHEAVVGEGGDDGATTCADSIDVGTPHRGEDARRAIRESGGATLCVGDEAIRETTAALGRLEGVFVEPACAAAVAGVERAIANGTIDAGEDVVVVITGTGLKDAETAQRVVGEQDA